MPTPITPPRRERPRRVHHRSTRPRLEVLEDRQLLSTLEGAQWAHGGRITYSFVPDGTSVGGIPSALYQTLNGSFPTATWQTAIEKAAAVWQAVANINLALVPDNGEAIGAAGDQQGDPNVGDIRIGAIPEPSGTLAYALLPPPYNGGTNSGDIFLNSNQNFGTSGFDLETVAIHELGHALGLGHSTVNAAVLYATYGGIKQTLNADDSGGLQQVYGAVPADPVNNSASNTATNLNASINANLQIAVSGASIANSGDYDWYSVTVPKNTTGTMTVTLQSSNLSSLSPRLTVYNGNGVGLGQATSTAYGATVSYSVSNVAAGQVYYLRAGSSTTGPGASGAYALLVNFGSSAQAVAAAPSTVVLSQPDKGGGSSQLSGGSSSGLGGLLGGALGLVGSVLNDLHQIVLGTMTAWGESLTVGPGGAHPHHGNQTAHHAEVGGTVGPWSGRRHHHV